MKVIGIAIINAYLCTRIGTEAARYSCDSWVNRDFQSVATPETMAKWQGSKTYNRDVTPAFEYQLTGSTFGVARAPDGRTLLTNRGAATLRYLLQDVKVRNRWFEGVIEPEDEHFVREEIITVWIAKM